MTAVEEAIPAIAADQSFKFISHFLIEPSPLNPRKHFNQDKLAELAASIGNGVGIIEPLVVRPKGDDRYELIAGERRWRAADMAGLRQVPAIVRELTDAQVLEMMVIENNQREDVNPLEEADGFARILETGYELERLAARLGRSKKYVYDRIKLLDLVPAAKQLLLDEKLTAGHGILLARLKPDDQQRAIHPQDGWAFQPDSAGGEDAEDLDADSFLDNVAGDVVDQVDPSAYRALKPRSVRELQASLARHVRFDVEHFAKAAPLDFGELGEQVAAAAAQPGRGKKVIAITFDHMVHPDAKDDGERTYGNTSFRFADGQEHPVDRWSSKVAVFPECEYSVLGVVAAGVEHYGRSFRVCIARDRCEAHWAKEIKAKRKNQKLRDAGQSSKAATNEKRGEDKWEIQRRKDEEERVAWDALKARALPALAEHVKGQKVTVDLVLQLFPRHQVASIEKLVGAITEKNLGQAIAVAVVVDGGSWSRQQFIASVKPFGFDLRAVEKATAAPAAEPKAPKAKKSVQTSAKKKKRK